MKPSKVEYKSEAKKYLKKLDKKTRERVEFAIAEYLATGIGDVKKLEGRKGYRLKVGKYRILFEIKGNVMWVTKIKSRGDVYKEEVEFFINHIKTVLNEYKETLKLLEEIDACAKEYAVTDKEGKIKHFKGKPGVGERFKNCILYFQCKGYNKIKAKKICGLIAAKKCKSGAKYACGIK